MNKYDKHNTTQHNNLICRDDIIEWDTVNWWKFIQRIERQEIDFRGKKVLDLGARNGGLSLYYALKGAKVTCSDLRGPSQKAEKLHEKYHIDNIEYKAIDATNIPSEYHQQFDVVSFKSVLGSIGSGGIEGEIKVIENIQKCLKPGGLIIFSENMEGTKLHSLFRKIFRKYKWHYQTDKEISSLFSDFHLVDKFYCGALGCFGPNETWRKLLGTLDTYIFDPVFPDSWKYIGVFIYRLDES